MKTSNRMFKIIKTQKFAIIFGLGILLSFFGGCSLDVDDGVIDIVGEGDVKSFEVELKEFTSLVHVCVGDVKITVGDTLLAVVKAQQNIFDLMSFKIDNDGFLVWAFNGKVNILDAKGITFEITVPAELRNIQLVGVGSIMLNGPKQDFMRIDHSGTGNINVYNLELNECEIEIKGVGNCYVRVNDLIEGRITGSGNIYYKGDPVRQVYLDGLGRVIDDN